MKLKKLSEHLAGHALWYAILAVGGVVGVALLGWLKTQSVKYLVGLVLGGAVVAALAIVVGRRLFRSWRRHRRAQRYLEQAFQKTVDNAKLVVHQASGSSPRKNIVELKHIYYIAADYSGSVVREAVIEAIAPLHCWEIGLGAEDSAPAVAYLEEIAFKAEQVDGPAQGRVVYLMSHNSDARDKRVAVFFLPFMVPGERRRVLITYTWPGLFSGLRAPEEAPLEGCAAPVGYELFQWTLEGHTRDPIPEATLSIYAAPELGLLVGEITGVQIPGGAVGPAPALPAPRERWQGICYRLPNAPIRKYELRARLAPKN